MSWFFFACPEKDSFIKLKINIKDIRLLMKRIYFQRKTGIEIFTSNKSYYFNFVVYVPKEKDELPKIDGEKNCNDFFSLISKSFPTDRFPLSINKKIIGYIDLYTEKLRDKKGLIKKEMKTDFFGYLFRYYQDKGDKYSKQNREVSSFDLLILINLISNRSYNDINQYPVFPVLFFLERATKGNEMEYNLFPRNCEKHISFQTETESGKERAKKVIDSYKGAVKENKEGEVEDEDLYYFNTNFSNCHYISHFMTRIFPYSFMNIEIQKNGFDAPNRLFFSILDTFSKISYVLNDRRELIPELYYLPEMLININRINFGKKQDESLVDNVLLPITFIEKEKGDYYGYFNYIAQMRGKLELSPKDIYNWIKLIFGKKQKYKDNKKGLLFSPISYVSFDEDFGRKFDKATIGAIEFGLIPTQTIFKDYDYEKKKLREKQIFKKTVKDLIQNSKDYYFINLNNKNINKSNNNKEYFFEDNKKNKIKIIGNEFGKVEIYINNIFIKEYYDHKDMITYIHYNKKLNMFVTTSLDGYACIYSFPNKLLSVRKSPYNSYFDFAFLGANPFPSILPYISFMTIE